MERYWISRILAFRGKDFSTHEKARGLELTAEEKARNCAILRIRVCVEHVIGGAKVYRIVRDVYRNHKQGFEDLVMETACGLHNFRLDYPLSA